MSEIAREPALQSSALQPESEMGGPLRTPPSFNITANAVQARPDSEAESEPETDALQLQAGEGFAPPSLPPSGQPTENGNGTGAFQLQDDPAHGESEEATGDAPGYFDIVSGTAETFITFMERVLGSTFANNTFSAEFSIMVSLGVGLDLAYGLAEVNGSGGVGLSGSINIQDDRAIRANYTIDTQLHTEATALYGLLRLSRTMVWSRGSGAIFDDINHFAADFMVTMNNLRELLTGEAPAPAPGELNQENLSDEPNVETTTSSQVTVNEVELSNEQWAESALIPEDETEFSATGYWGDSEDSEFYYTEIDGERSVRRGSGTTEFWGFDIQVGDIRVSFQRTAGNFSGDQNVDNDDIFHVYSLDVLGVGADRIINNQPLTDNGFAGLLGPEGASQAADVSPDNPDGFSQFVNQQSERIRQWLLSMNLGGDVDASLNVNDGVRVVFNYEDSLGEMVLQYVRVSRIVGGVEFELDAEVSTRNALAIEGTLGVEANAEVATSIYEQLGTGTLTYLETVYNGIVYTEEEVSQGLATSTHGRWEIYEDTHQSEILGIIAEVGAAPDSDGVYSMPRREVQDAVDAGIYDAGAAAAFFATASADPAAAMVDLRGYLDAKFIAHQADQAAFATGTDGVDTYAEANDGRNPWVEVVGGNSSMLLEMHQNDTPQLQWSIYNPDNEESPRPQTLLDAILQDQEVSMQLELEKLDRYQVFEEGYETYDENLPTMRAGNLNAHFARGISEDEAAIEIRNWLYIAYGFIFSIPPAKADVFAELNPGEWFYRGYESYHQGHIQHDPDALPIFATIEHDYVMATIPVFDQLARHILRNIQVVETAE